jgi:hypothetical protein
MNNRNEASTGFIQLHFMDERINQVVSLGGAEFDSDQALDAAWASIPAFEGHTAFMADRLDANHDIIDEKPVSAETCSVLLKKPINVLIEEGRLQLQAYLASLESKLIRRG